MFTLKAGIPLAYPKFQILADFVILLLVRENHYLTDFFIEEFMVNFYK